MTDQRAYSTSDPAVLAAYHRAVADRDSWKDRLKTDVEALGAGPRYFGMRGAMGSPASLSGLEQKGEHVPDGWRTVRGHLEPRRGKPGEQARQWLAEHQPVDIRHALVGRGMPRSVWIPASEGSFSYRVVSPEFFMHDETIWVLYDAEPGSGESGFDTEKCTWTPRKLSEFYAAKESFDAAQAAVTA